MKAVLRPIFFDPGKDENFDKHLNIVKNLLGNEAVFLDPLPLGTSPGNADAVIFPQMLGEAYSRVSDFRQIDLPIMVITSEFGTVNMWDWEVVHFLRQQGIATICPPSLEDTLLVCRALVTKRRLTESKFVVYQDDPAGPTGQQSDIFKRFYWLEAEAPRRMLEKYGVKVEYRSFRELAKRAAAISDGEAEATIKAWEKSHETVTGRPLLSAVKLYMQVKEEYKRESNIISMGINCLNESRSCDTTPCLAWNLLYEEENLVWGCEGDIMTMLTEILMDKILQVPFFMTNLYPFIMGQAALSHERIPHFPDVEEPENHILAAHCGYFGLIPEKFSNSWKFKNRVLAMVNENATVIDATMQKGPVTLIKFHPGLNKLSLCEADLRGYIQYENSDCLNGGILKIRDGHNFVENVISHHYILGAGHLKYSLKMIAKIFDFELDEL